MMKSLICLSLILLPLLSVVEGSLGGGLGSAKPIKDVSNPDVVAIAKYAIEEHNKQSKANLVYVEIVRGTEQVISGKKYDLIIAAKKDGGVSKNYEAVVVERVWEKFRELESFKAV